MSYNPAVPQATDRLSVSQGDLLTNFNQLNTVYQIDHFAYNDATANATKHRYVHLPDLASTPPAAPAAANGVAYARTTNSQTYPFWRRDTFAEDLPMMPIKAFVSFTATGAAGAQTINQQFNVTSVDRAVVGNNMTVVLTRPMRTTTYGIIAMGTVVSGSYTITNTTTFVVNIGSGNLTGFLYTIIVLEI